MENEGEYKVDREKDTESISFKKIKNNNAANDSFAANHVHFIAPSQLNFIPSEEGNMLRDSMLSPESRMNALDRQAQYYKKQFAYKEGTVLYLTLDREFPYPEHTDDNASIVGFLSSSEMLLDGRGVLVRKEGNKLIIELFVDIKPREIYYVVFLASAKPEKRDGTETTDDIKVV